MTHRIALSSILAALVFIGAQAATADSSRRVFEAAALAEETAGSTQVMARVRDLARSGRPAEAVARARAVLEDPASGPAVRERVRYETLLALAGSDPDAPAAGFVRESMDVAPTVFVRLDEPGHEIVVPAWDARAAAGYAQRRWREREASTATGALLALRGDLAVPALAVAARTADAPLFARALAAAPGPEAIGALRDDLGAFGPGERVDILSAALDRPDLASAALLGLAAEAPTDPRAEALLWSRLSSPDHGASAAAALARLETRDVALRLEDLATGDGDPRAARPACCRPGSPRPPGPRPAPGAGRGVPRTCGSRPPA